MCLASTFQGAVDIDFGFAPFDRLAFVVEALAAAQAEFYLGP